MSDESAVLEAFPPRKIHTSGGDYAEGGINKRQGLFVELRIAGLTSGPPGAGFMPI